MENSPFSEIKLLVFDFDGTLVSSTLPGFKKIWQVMEILELPKVSEEFLRLHWGKKFPELVKDICHHVGVDGEYIEEFLRLEKQIVSVYELNQELFFTLAELRRQGMLIAMLTSRDIDSLYLSSKKLGFSLQDFDFVQTPEDTEYHKPDGRVFDPLLKWAETKSCTPENIIYFGDTINYDLAAAKDRDKPLRFVGVVSGICTPSDFLRNQVADIVYGIQGLAAYLQSLVGLNWTVGLN